MPPLRLMQMLCTSNHGRRPSDITRRMLQQTGPMRPLTTTKLMLAAPKTSSVTRQREARMLRLSLSILAASCLLVASPLEALAHDPSASPLSKVSQRIGAAEVSVEYSSPGVKSRKIWGELVPLGKIWRTGANASTKISFSKDVLVAGRLVKAGTYSLMTIPGASGWTVILNRNTAIRGDMSNYKTGEDVARVAASATMVPHRERMTFIFSDATEESVALDLEWETLRVRIPISLAVRAAGSTP